MKEIIICVGISGSGKSTWSTNFIKENPNYLRINRDDIRKTLVGDLNGYYQRKDLDIIEDIVTNAEDDLFSQYLWNDYNIIIDNTNLNIKYINRWFIHNDLNGVSTSKVKFKLFDIESVTFCKKRVSFRDNLTYNQVSYIDKQNQQYQEIKKYILEYHKDKII